MKREDDQELWDLLGKGEAPRLSPFFARNVMRAIRQKRTWRDRFANWMRPGRLIPTGAVALAMVAAAVSLHRPVVVSPAPDAMPEGIAQLDTTDYEVVADLDDLLAMEEDNLWDDGDTSSL